MQFQENPSNGNRGRTEKVLYSPREIILLINRPQPNLQRSCGMRRDARCGFFREILPKESRIAFHCLSVATKIITHASTVLRVNFRENPLNRSQHTTEKVIFSPRKPLSLLTVRIQTYIICNACAGSYRYEVS